MCWFGVGLVLVVFCRGWFLYGGVWLVWCDVLWCVDVVVCFCLCW